MDFKSVGLMGAILAVGAAGYGPYKKHIEAEQTCISMARGLVVRNSRSATIKADGKPVFSEPRELPPFDTVKEIQDYCSDSQDIEGPIECYRDSILVTLEEHQHVAISEELKEDALKIKGECDWLYSAKKNQ